MPWLQWVFFVSFSGEEGTVCRVTGGRRGGREEKRREEKERKKKKEKGGGGEGAG